MGYRGEIAFLARWLAEVHEDPAPVLINFRLMRNLAAGELAARSGSEHGTGKTFLYDVNGLPKGQKITIKNTSPEHQTPRWQIGGHTIGQETKWTGAFVTPEEALAQLQKEIDNADNATTDQITAIAESAGWKSIPIQSTNSLAFAVGPMMVRVRLNDKNWAYYSEVVDGKSPDKWGKDMPSLIAFSSNHDNYTTSIALLTQPCDRLQVIQGMRSRAGV